MSGILDGKVALVTGAGSGIGRAAAIAFAREGARVAVADLDETAARETADMIGGESGSVLSLRCDVSVSADVLSLVDTTVEGFGRLDCAFNSAGILGDVSPMAEYPDETWQRVISVNLTGVWLCMKQEIRQMLAQRAAETAREGEAGRRRAAGVVVNAASVAGLKASTFEISAYVASKHGVVGLTRAAAREYGPQGIRVNAVCPGLVETPLAEPLIGGGEGRAQASPYPLGRYGETAEIADAAVWLCSDAASFVTGEAMRIDGGALA